MVSRGRARLGCLFSLLLIAVLVYYGIPLVGMYWDYYQLSDEMRTAARFAQTTTDEEILRRLRAKVNELELPAEANRFTIRRTQIPPTVVIETRYRQAIELPFQQRRITFRPRAEVRQ
ncbi:MAG: hypothetical protein ACT4PM_14450 [Gemmatimonadales bacterium]